MLKIECRCCKENTEKKIIIDRKPLQKVNIALPDNYEEFYCSSIIKTKRLWKKGERGKSIYKWIEENCRNNILIKKRTEV